MAATVFFLMHVHVLFVTYRRGVFTAQIPRDPRSNFASVCLDFESQLVEFDGEDDPVHPLVNYPPKIAVAALVNSLKGLSSRLIRPKDYRSIRRMLWGKSPWSPSYFAGSCGGAPIAVIRQISRHHRGRRRSSHRHPGSRERGVRNEGRHRL
jgi:putative transposase